MAEKSIPSGMIMPYGLAIGNALRKPDTSIDELVALRDHAQSIVSAQGDLVAALKSLDDAIAQGKDKAAAAPVSPRTANIPRRDAVFSDLLMDVSPNKTIG